MKVLIFHGYLLRGTGSNIYNANVARALAGLGHDVHLLCQEGEAERLDWIDAVGRWPDGRLDVLASERGQSPGSGSITAYLPDIGGLLPVYVEDRYEGFRVKTFSALSEAELDAYIAANVAAVKDVAALAGGIDAALSNHLVMGPVILARAGLRFAAKVHGSALSYTVRRDARFIPYAKEGIAAAAAVLVGSGHTGHSLFEVIRDVEVERKTRLGPPGVDIEEFVPVERDRAAAVLEAIATRVEGEAGGEDSFARDGAAVADALRHYGAAEGLRVVFIGKLIVSKGVDLLLAAWPLIVAANPGARLLVGGFGAYSGGLQRLWTAIEDGDLDDAREVGRLGWALEGGEAAPLRLLSAFMEAPADEWLAACRAARGSLAFSGRLEHAEVAQVIAASDAMVVPSTFPEAFGMVAAEAAATGALPVCAEHSGLAEVAAALDHELPPAARGLTAFGLDDDPVAGIAARTNRWFSLSATDRAQAEAALSATVRERWSWQGVARSLLEACDGQLDRLDPIPPPSAVLARPDGADRTHPPSQ